MDQTMDFPGGTSIGITAEEMGKCLMGMFKPPANSVILRAGDHRGREVLENHQAIAPRRDWLVRRKGTSSDVVTPESSGGVESQNSVGLLISGSSRPRVEFRIPQAV
jgi:hypothetical protein